MFEIISKISQKLASRNRCLPRLSLTRGYLIMLAICLFAGFIISSIWASRGCCNLQIMKYFFFEISKWWNFRTERSSIRFLSEWSYNQISRCITIRRKSCWLLPLVVRNRKQSDLCQLGGKGDFPGWPGCIVRRLLITSENATCFHCGEGNISKPFRGSQMSTNFWQCLLEQADVLRLN